MIAMLGPGREPFKHLYSLVNISLDAIPIRQEMKTRRHMLFTKESNPLNPKQKGVLRDRGPRHFKARTGSRALLCNGTEEHPVCHFKTDRARTQRSTFLLPK